MDYLKEPQPRVVSKPTLRRLPCYLNYLQSQAEAGRTTISATAVASALGLNEVQVRKDFSAASRSGGRPKTGYSIVQLIADIEEFLGYRNTKEAVLVGVGQLGSALLSYKGFRQCGMRIIAAFDNDPDKIGTEIDGIKIYDVRDLVHICKRTNVRIGIITTPQSHAQEVCRDMLAGGILAVWNFSPTHLDVPEHIIVHNENLAVTLSMISYDLTTALEKKDRKEPAPC